MGGPAVCTFCGASLLPEDRFCPACGGAIALSEAPAPTHERSSPEKGHTWQPLALWGAAWAAGPILHGLSRGQPGAWLVAGGIWFLGGIVAGTGLRRASPAGASAPPVQFLLATAVGWAVLLGLLPWVRVLMGPFYTPYLVRDLVAVAISAALAGVAGAWLARREATRRGLVPPSALRAGLGWGAGAVLVGLVQLTLTYL